MSAVVDLFYLTAEKTYAVSTNGIELIFSACHQLNPAGFYKEAAWAYVCQL